MKASNLKNKIRILEYSFDEEDNCKREIFRDVYASVKIMHQDSVRSLDRTNFGDIIIAEYYIFTIRFCKFINEDMRILYKNKLYKIFRIVDVGEKSRELKVYALKLKDLF